MPSLSRGIPGLDSRCWLVYAMGCCSLPIGCGAQRPQYGNHIGEEGRGTCQRSQGFYKNHQVNLALAVQSFVPPDRHPLLENRVSRRLLCRDLTGFLMRTNHTQIIPTFRSWQTPAKDAM